MIDRKSARPEPRFLSGNWYAVIETRQDGDVIRTYVYGSSKEEVEHKVAELLGDKQPAVQVPLFGEG